MTCNLCFICSRRIQRYFEFSNRKQTAAGTLCELLGLQLNDNTFSFGGKFLQAPYCPQCVSKMKEIRQMLNDLKDLKIKIEGEKNLLKNKLKETCSKRGSLKENLDDNNDDYGGNHFHPFDRFREEVVEEIEATYPNPTAWARISTPTNNSAFSLKLNKNEDSSLTLKSETIQSTKRLRSEVKAAGKTSPPQLRIGPRRRLSPVKEIRTEVAEADNLDQEIVSEVTPEVETITADLVTELAEDVEIGDDPDTEEFINIVYEDDHGEADVDQEGSDMDTGSGLEEQEIFVNSNEYGQFLCPYAPACNSTFDATDKTEFLQHIRSEHEGKIPVTGTGTGIRTESSEKSATSTSQAVGKWFACKFCSESHASLVLLKAHCAENHEDEEWVPNRSPSRRLKPIAEATEGIKKLKEPLAKPVVEEDNGNNEDGEGRNFKCTFCSAAFRRVESWINHTRRHTGVKPHKCDQCSEAFTVRRDWTYHRFKAHNIGKCHLCSNCNKKFCYQHQLNKHLLTCLPK